MVGRPGIQSPGRPFFLSRMLIVSYIDHCRKKDWHLRVWPTGKPEQVRIIPFRCLSWRHEGECRQWRGAQDFLRVQEAMLSLEDWSHCVLTYEPAGRKVSYRIFRGAIRQWDMLRKRLIREYGNLKYIQTWEQHESGWPHVHIAISNVMISQLCEVCSGTWDQKKVIGRRNFRRILKQHAVPCGFGYIGYLEAIRSRSHMATYLTKKSKELVDGSGKCQLPIHAPRNFRRLRASAGLLPPPYSDPDLTGELVKRPIGGEVLTKEVGGHGGPPTFPASCRLAPDPEIMGRLY
jgi:hypothetical protein